MSIDLYSALMGAGRYPTSLRGADLSKRNTTAPSSSAENQLDALMDTVGRARVDSRE